MKAILFVLSIGITISFAQTNLSGGIYSSETWDVTGSPYIVSGNLVVFEGVEITVEPGVFVEFDPGASLELRGKLVSIGTEADPISFTSSLSSPIMGSWNGIKVIGTTNPLGVGDQVTMEHTKGMYAQTFIDLDAAYHGPYNFNHCYFAQNQKVNEDGGSPSTNFDYCTFEANHQALDWCQFDNRASHCSFINNYIGLVGIEKVDTCYFSGHTSFAMAPYGVTTGCTIDYNVIGVKTGFNAVNHTFVNNTVINNEVGMEISSFFNGSHNVTGNTICNNTTYNVKLLSTNNADLGMNCWCTMDEGQILSTIYDGYDNTAYGLVDVSPVSNNCDQPSIVRVSELPVSELSVSVYPNPFNETIHFKTEIESIISLSIFDAFGRLVFTDEFQSETSIRGLEVDRGIYLYTLKSEDGSTLTGKLIKE